MKKTNRIEMTVSEIIAAVNDSIMTVSEIRETVARTQMTKAEIEAEASDWCGTDWTAEDIEEITERYEDEYGIILADDEKEDLKKALEQRNPDYRKWCIFFYDSNKSWHGETLSDSMHRVDVEVDSEELAIELATEIIMDHYTDDCDYICIDRENGILLPGYLDEDNYDEDDTICLTYHHTGRPSDCGWTGHGEIY